MTLWSTTTHQNFPNLTESSGIPKYWGINLNYLKYWILKSMHRNFLYDSIHLTINLFEFTTTLKIISRSILTLWSTTTQQNFPNSTGSSEIQKYWGINLNYLKYWILKSMHRNILYDSINLTINLFEFTKIITDNISVNFYVMKCHDTATLS